MSEHTRASHGDPAPLASAEQPTAYAAFQRAVSAGMDKMMRDMHVGGRSGNVDIDFLEMMIPHHEGAVEMARLVLIHGRDPLVRRLAEEIIAGQATEITAMRARLARLRSGPDDEPGGFPVLGSTRGR